MGDPATATSEVAEGLAPYWLSAALRAQAVAARTYALFRAASTQSPLYDLDDSTSSQVYGGIRKEHPRTNRAVNETEGLILTWKGKPAREYM